MIKYSYDFRVVTVFYIYKEVANEEEDIGMFYFTYYGDKRHM